MKRVALLTAVALAGFGFLLAQTGQSRGPAGVPSGGYQVRALFDNAAFAVAGEQVRIAGAPVGSIASVGVTKRDLAAVTLQINNAAFVPFHANATCAIRPQSLIAERYVDCSPGTSATPALARIRRGAGAGSYLLPVTRTSASIDPDIVQDISQEPLRERLSVILDELGTGLAARGSDLNAVIRRANPALAQTDQVFRILAQQSHVLAGLARDADTVLAPLGRARRQLADFVVQANTTAVASAERASDISSGIHLLPGFLSRLKPLMADLGRLADQGTPLMTSLSSSAAAVNRQFSEVVPFATAARTALINLGNAAQQSERSLLATEPLAQRLDRLGSAAGPSATELDRLTANLQSTGGIDDLMSVLFYGTGATNGFDADGHYVRTDALVGSCTAYARVAVPGCSSNFAQASASDASTAAAPVRARPATGSDGTSDGTTAGHPVLAGAAASVARQAVDEVVDEARTARTSHLAGLLAYLAGGTT